jgi:cation transport protein ChaC
MKLTAELVDRCRREVADSGPEPGLGYLDDDDYEAMLDATLAGRDPAEPAWLFAYGSLIWKPEVAHVDERVALLRGWHRQFCIRMTRWRGTPERPGLMMGLDRGGQCRGVAFRLPDGDLRTHFDQLFRREMTAKPPTYRPAWVKLETDSGVISALAFVINRAGRTYAGRFDDDETATVLAEACGHLGSCAEYLHNTVSHLESRGIHDRHLWRLQELVAQRIERRA